MTAQNHTARSVDRNLDNLDNPTTWLRPGDAIMAGGVDWAWCYVRFEDVRGFPFYLAGSNGTAWSCRTRGGRLVAWQQMTPYLDGTGRLAVGLRRAGRLFRMPIARLVAETFIGPRPPGMEACHNDGDPSNNHFWNLRWDTHLANMADRERHGRTTRGSKNAEAKIAEEQAAEILRRYAAGETQYELAAAFGLSQSTIGRITRGENWRHVPRPPGLPSPKTYRKRTTSKLSTD